MWDSVCGPCLYSHCWEGGIKDTGWGWCKGPGEARGDGTQTRGRLDSDWRGDGSSDRKGRRTDHSSGRGSWWNVEEAHATGPLFSPLGWWQAREGGRGPGERCSGEQVTRPCKRPIRWLWRACGGFAWTSPWPSSTPGARASCPGWGWLIWGLPALTQNSRGCDHQLGGVVLGSEVHLCPWHGLEMFKNLQMATSHWQNDPSKGNLRWRCELTQ